MAPVWAISTTSNLRVQLFFAILALVALAGAVILVAARLLGRRSALLGEIAAVVGSARVLLAWLVATVAMLGSLYFSEVAELPPCRLCWYQRGAMYPLVVVLAVHGLTGWRPLRWYALASAAVGLCISSWHYLVEWFPSLEPTNVCALDNPCTTVWFRRMGFVTIPFMAGCGFAAILALLITRQPVADEADADVLGGTPVGT